VNETMGADIRIHHMPELGSWTVEARQLGYSAAGTSEWGTARRHAGELLTDALNSRVPQIFDTVRDADGERRILNVVDTEAARDKLQLIKQAFQDWVWTDPDRTDRLARVYNDRFNNIAPRKFDGSHLQLPGACRAFELFAHQKRGIWRIISSGSTYLAHAVGAGKTMTMTAAIMEQRRLGLIDAPVERAISALRKLRNAFAHSAESASLADDTHLARELCPVCIAHRACTHVMQRHLRLCGEESHDDFVAAHFQREDDAGQAVLN